MAWRDVLGFEQAEELDFSTVHNRYRERMLALNAPTDLDHITKLNAALESARQELATRGV